MDKILTVTIPSYNAENDLPKVLGLLTESKLIEKLDIVIVNDGSSDNTREVAGKYAKQYPDSIRAINKVNGGHGSTINVGIELARGKYFKVVDSDDWLDPKVLDRFIMDLEGENEDVIFNPFYTFDDKTKKVNIFNKFTNDLKLEKTYSFDEYSFAHLPSMHSFTFKTKKLKEANFKIDEHAYYVDVEYILFPLTNCDTFKMLRYPLYFYRINQSGQSVSIESLKNNKDRHEFVLTSISNYIEKNDGKLSKCKKETMVNRLSQMIATQYKIISLLPITKETYRELRNFEKKVNDKLIFDDETINLPIKLLLKSNFMLLPIIHYLAIFKMKTAHV
ncbi:glycosyltransferase family 2 protein [Pediococcus pentosaceus]|uniref:glycosyltransferase family 2 protein n=1 Tax=Pediococcus pentosaceus TaxID=1255 RepID=UPI001C1EFA3B|nr:glycosyltransferase family 2 protein [Pediococcus pentosaceus]MBU7003678.1 glycosyltransferase family 2 protein [Pediococcus pentosaceus]MCG9225688.1 glycosyltransferase family 2 protein [Pediococcus pentosaceus]MDA8035693.1 glycosyltransferase family 2 protein [Pediococcus pentosaceus]